MPWRANSRTGGPLGKRLDNPGQPQFLDDVIGALAPRAAQTVPAEMGVDCAAGFPHADGDPAFLSAIGEVHAARFASRFDPPGRFEQSGARMWREPGSWVALLWGDVLTDEVRESFAPRA